MGKDRSGTFHPGKGKPSGVNKEEGTGITATPREKMNEYVDITKKYMEDDDTMGEAVRVRHPNRNTSKGENSNNPKENADQLHNRGLPVAEEETIKAEEFPAQLTKEILTELSTYQASNCISLYFVTNEPGSEASGRKYAINFKNALQQVSADLKKREVPESVIGRMLAPGLGLVDDDVFWVDLNAGLAVFIADGYCRYIKMPIAPMANEIICQPKFYLNPLIPMMTSSLYFYVLVISKKQVKLFRADAFGIQFVPVPNLPAEMNDVKRLSDKDATTFRTGGRGGTGGANFHGIAGGNADNKDNIATYFEAVDDVLFKEIFNKENVPLLLAGVEYEIPIYRSVCDYHNVCKESLTGNYKDDETGTIYKEAMEVMKDYFLQHQKKALDAYFNQSASLLTTDLPVKIIPAAWYGRVSHLFARKGDHIWGSFDEQTGEVTLHDAPSNESEDLLDQAVIKTYMSGGEVYVLDAAAMPSRSSLAALLRY